VGEWRESVGTALTPLPNRYSSPCDLVELAATTEDWSIGHRTSVHERACGRLWALLFTQSGAFWATSQTRAGVAPGREICRIVLGLLVFLPHNGWSRDWQTHRIQRARPRLPLDSPTTITISGGGSP